MDSINLRLKQIFVTSHKLRPDIFFNSEPCTGNKALLVTARIGEHWCRRRHFLAGSHAQFQPCFMGYSPIEDTGVQYFC